MLEFIYLFCLLILNIYSFLESSEIFFPRVIFTPTIYSYKLCEKNENCQVICHLVNDIYFHVLFYFFHVSHSSFGTIPAAASTPAPASPLVVIEACNAPDPTAPRPATASSGWNCHTKAFGNILGNCCFRYNDLKATNPPDKPTTKQQMELSPG